MWSASKGIVHDDDYFVDAAEFENLRYQRLWIQYDKSLSISIKSPDGLEDHPQSEGREKGYLGKVYHDRSLGRRCVSKESRLYLACAGHIKGTRQFQK